jgi:hypothetical protein
MVQSNGLGAQVPGAPAQGRATPGLAGCSHGWPAKFLGSPEWPGGDSGLRDVTFQSAAHTPVSVPFQHLAISTSFNSLPQVAVRALDHAGNMPISVLSAIFCLLLYPECAHSVSWLAGVARTAASESPASSLPRSKARISSSSPRPSSFLAPAICPARSLVSLCQRCMNASAEKRLFRQVFPIALASIRAFFLLPVFCSRG